MKKLNNKYSQSGFTLIEVIISIALIAIVSSALISLFTGAMIDVKKAGRNSKEHYTAQDKIESNISDSTAVDSDVATSADSITLNFPTSTFSVSGRRVDVKYPYKNKTKTLTSFTIN